MQGEKVLEPGSDVDGGPPQKRGRGPVQFIVSTYRRSPSLVIGTTIIIILILLAAFAPLLTSYSPIDLDVANRLQSPSAEHYFGTDELGRDIWTRSLYGARISLSTAFFATMIAMTIGVPLGLISGYFGGWTDAITMRYVDVQIAVPGILLAMMIILFIGQGFFALVVAIGIGSVPSFARIVRASTLSIQSDEYVSAVKAMGGGHTYTMFRTILPNSMGPIIVQMVITAAVAVLLEAALSFLGLGTVPPTPSWGAMLQSGKSYLNEAPYYAVMPGIMLTVTVVGLDLIGRGLQKVRGSSASASAEIAGRT
jgi:peptide/nickel transport system permease protein